MRKLFIDIHYHIADGSAAGSSPIYKICVHGLFSNVSGLNGLNDIVEKEDIRQPGHRANYKYNPLWKK